VEQVKSSGLAAMEDLEKMTRSFGELRNEFDILKKELAVFRTRTAPAAKRDV
jgi:hypothetical protein